MSEVAFEMGVDPTAGELREMLDSPMGRQLARRMAVEAADEPLPEAARRLWARFAERIIPYRISYLEMALENSNGKAERVRATERYLGEKRGDPLAMLEAVRSAEHDQCQLASKAMLDRLVGCLKGDRERLARVLLEAGRMRLLRGVRGPLARAFDAADQEARARGGAESNEVVAARLEARLLDRRRRTGRAAAPRKKARRGEKHEQRVLPLEQSDKRG
jgi:hypothetical protein